MTALLEVDDITKRFGGIVALDALNLSLQPGELRCILGPNGCGKTTLFNVLTGAFKPTSGTVRFRGEAISGKGPIAISRRGVSRKFQVPGIFPELTVLQNVALPIAAASRKPTLRSLIWHKVDPARLAELLDFAGLTDKADVLASDLAHGEKQRLEIVMLLAVDADLLLLDEPTAGMSKGETATIAALIRRLTSEFGKTVLVIEHDMQFVLDLDCRITVMARGTVIAEGTYDEVRNNPQVIECYLGQAS
ncbi:ABC transporter ATP-binding protein [Roseobacter litoralis]|uniref:ABC transporter ATP-binding protein n=1 Tax=Roseobacter litoralis TaxID=42443 RepID=UPI0024943D5D|nr:ABC transporter ATP-binding protein [Roseobacter litoralis]